MSARSADALAANEGKVSAGTQYNIDQRYWYST